MRLITTSVGESVSVPHQTDSSPTTLLTLSVIQRKPKTDTFGNNLFVRADTSKLLADNMLKKLFRYIGNERNVAPTLDKVIQK